MLNSFELEKTRRSRALKLAANSGERVSNESLHHLVFDSLFFAFQQMRAVSLFFLAAATSRCRARDGRGRHPVSLQCDETFGGRRNEVRISVSHSDRRAGWVDVSQTRKKGREVKIAIGAHAQRSREHHLFYFAGFNRFETLLNLREVTPVVAVGLYANLGTLLAHGVRKNEVRLHRGNVYKIRRLL